MKFYLPICLLALASMTFSIKYHNLDPQIKMISPQIIDPSKPTQKDDTATQNKNQISATADTNQTLQRINRPEPTVPTQTPAKNNTQPNPPNAQETPLNSQNVNSLQTDLNQTLQRINRPELAQPTITPTPQLLNQPVNNPANQPNQVPPSPQSNKVFNSGEPQQNKQNPPQIINQTFINVTNPKNDTKKKEQEEEVVTEETYYVYYPEYYELEPVYYAPSPIYYTYPIQVAQYCTTYDLLSAYDNTNTLVDVYYRKNNKKVQPEKTQLSKDKAEEILKRMKKEMFNDENFDLNQFRKNHLIYDKNWLRAQSRISRVLFLEERIKELKAKMNKA